MRASLISLFLMMVVISGCAHSVRQDEVAKKGEAVMPFDLEQTTHIFEKIEEGGLQQVVADDPNNLEQIKLIREHLAIEAARFAEGNFHDPSMIHGAQMPGLHELATNAAAIRIEYSEVPDGGQILYTTDTPDLIKAIHLWFDAQLSDHGNHAAGHR